MKKIKVLHYLFDLGLGGTQKTCLLFVKHTNDKMDNCLVFPTGGVRERFFEFREIMHSDRMFEIEKTQQDFQRIVDHIQPDIVHTYRSGFCEFPEPGVDFCLSDTKFVETNVFGFIDPSPQVHKTLFMSKWLMDHAARMNPAVNASPRFDFVNNPVELPETNKKWPNRPANIVLGRCGRDDNGIYDDTNVQAARILRRQGHDVGFLVVAPPLNMVKDLRKYRIPFSAIPPTVDPLILSEFYNAVDIYAHARADGETFGVNIAEAMIHGKPVVTHIAVPSNQMMGVFQSQTELVDHERTGFVSSRVPDEYADHLRRLIKNPGLQVEFGERGRDKAIREYHVRPVIDKLAGIYEGLVYG